MQFVQSIEQSSSNCFKLICSPIQQDALIRKYEALHFLHRADSILESYDRSVQNNIQLSNWASEFLNDMASFNHSVFQSAFKDSKYRCVFSDLQIVQARILLLLVNSQSTDIAQLYASNWSLPSDFQSIFSNFLKDLNDCDIQIRMLSADFIGIPWDLIDEISSPVLNLPICIDVQVKRAPEIVYTGNVHVPLSHLQAKAEEDPDSYLWVIVLNCKQAFRGIAPSLAGSRVLQVRTYKQFHGIPKQGFNSDKSKPEIIRDQLMDALGLSKLINPH